MAKYYALVAGLPIVTAEMQRPPVTTEEFYTELQGYSWGTPQCSFA